MISSKRITGIVGVVLCVWLAQTAWAFEPIHIDIEQPSSSTAAGYVRLTADSRWDNGTELSLGNGVTIGWLDYCEASYRDRGAVYPDLLTRDMIHWSSSNGPETLEIRGLTADNYDLTLYGTDPQFPDKRTSFAIDQDNDGAPDVLLEIHNPNGEHSETVAVTVSAAGVLSITIDGIGGASGSAVQ